MFDSLTRLFRRRRGPRDYTADVMARAVQEGRRNGKGDYPVGRISVPSYGEASLSLGEGDAILIPVPRGSSNEKLDAYARLRDTNPDVSDGIWVWVRMCNTGHTVRVVNRKTAQLSTDFDERVRDLAQRVDTNGGLDGLLNRFLLSYFTRGAFAGEIVINNARDDINGIVAIPVRTVRFGYLKKDFPTEGGRQDYTKIPANSPLRAFQVVTGEDPVELNPNTFFYYALDPDEDSPYGRSIIASLEETVFYQNQVVPAMARAQVNAGWPRIHVQYRPDLQKRGESDEEYKARIEQNFNKIVEFMEDLDVDTNFVTFNNVIMEYKQASNPTERFYEKFRAIEEQIISGLHLVPMLMGRAYGPAGSWGEAQSRLMERAAMSAQLGAKRFIEKVCDLALALWGVPEFRSEVTFNRPNLHEAVKAAQAEKLRYEVGRLLWEDGIINQEQLASRMGVSKPARELKAPPGKQRGGRGSERIVQPLYII